MSRKAGTLGTAFLQSWSAVHTFVLPSPELISYFRVFHLNLLQHVKRALQQIQGEAGGHTCLTNKSLTKDERTLVAAVIQNQKNNTVYLPIL
jgi:hypothetical protein